MARIQIAQKFNFIYGEIDPIIESRADYAALPGHSRRTKNVYSTESGALFNRAGKRFLADLGAELGEVGPFCAFSFNSTKDIKYILVFFDRGFAPFDLEELDFVRDTKNDILKITTPYLAEDFFSPQKVKQICAKQSANVLYLAHEKYPFAQIRYFDRHTWTYNAISFNNGPWKEFNSNKGYLISAGGTKGGIILNSTTDNPSADLTLQPYQLGLNESITSLTWTINGVVGPMINNPADLNANAEMAVRYLLQANTDLQAAGSISTQTVTAVNNQINYSGQAISCEIVIHNSESGEDKTLNTAASFTTTGGEGLPIFETNMVGQFIQLQYLDTSTKSWSMDTEGYNTNDIVKSGENYYKVVSAGGKTGFQQPKHTEGVVSDGKLMFQYLHSGLGRAQITQYISPYRVQAQVLDYMPDGIKTYKYRFGLVDNITYPNSVDFIDARMTLGYNSAEGPVKVFSQPDDYLNFSDYIYGSVTSESAIKMIIQSEFARINWIKRIGPAVVAGTDNGIVRTYAPDDGVLTPSNIISPFISTAAASAILPIDIDGNLLYVSKDRINLYLAQYDFNSNSYIKNNLLKLVKYQFRRKISDICYLDYPFNAVSIRLQNGENKLLFLNLNEETKGVFANDMLDMELSDNIMNFNLDGDQAVAIGIYDNRYLVMEEYRNIYDTTGQQPPLDMYSEAAFTTDAEGKYLMTMTLPNKLFNDNLQSAIFLYGARTLELSRSMRQALAPGAEIDISGLKIKRADGCKLQFGQPQDVAAVLIPKYEGQPNKDGVAVAENIFQIFNTQDFKYGQTEENLRAFSDNLPKEERRAGNFYSGEFDREQDCVSNLRHTEQNTKVLTNAPEIIIKNNGANNFCICGILSFE